MKVRGKSKQNMWKKGEAKEKNEDKGYDYTGYMGRGRK